MKIMSKHITKRAMIALFMCALLAISTIFWEKLFGQQLDVPVVADRKPRSASTKSDKPAKVKSGNDIERRMRELIAKNQQLNPDDASLDIKTRWENAMNYDGDFMTKRDMFSSIFKTMCSEGKQFEALQLIQNSIPDSDLKDLLFTSLFNHLYLDDQLDLVKKAENKEFVKNVTSIIADRIKSINDIEKIDFLLEDKEVGSQIVNSIAMGQFELVNRGVIDAEVALDVFLGITEKFSDLNPTLNLDQIRSGLLQFIRGDTIFKLWDKLTITGDDFLSGGLSKDLVSQMARHDPRLAFDVLTKSNYKGSYKPIFDTLLERDPIQANNFFEENKGKFDPAIVNEFYFSYAGKLSNDKNLSDAWSYVNQIKDPEIKKKAEGQVWAKERDMVRNTVNAAPQKAIEELVSGKSQHDSYWIEEAMDVWMAKDFDNAEKWYQDNWKNLPADKAQYAAASFAKQAIKTGDIEVAEQWLPYIKDPKTKERIQAEVSKAAGE